MIDGIDRVGRGSGDSRGFCSGMIQSSTDSSDLRSASLFSNVFMFPLCSKQFAMLVRDEIPLGPIFSPRGYDKWLNRSGFQILAPKLN